MKRLLWILVVLIAVLTAAAIAIPSLIDLEPVKARWLPVAEQALDRQVSVGRVTLSLFPPVGVTIQDVSVMDEPAFSRDPFLTAETVTARVALWPLLQRRVEVSQLIVKRPVIELVKDAQGRWNYETLGRGPGPPDGEQLPGSPVPTDQPPLPLAATVRLIKGDIAIIDRTRKAPWDEVRVEPFDMTAKNLRPGQEALVQLSARILPWVQTVTLSGRLQLAASGLAVEGADIQVTVGDHEIRLRARQQAGRIDAEVAMESLRVGDLLVKELHALGKVESGTIDVESVTAQLFGGAIQLHGTIGVPPVGQPFQVEVAGDNIAVEELARMVSAQEPRLMGTGTFSASLRGEVGAQWSSAEGGWRGLLGGLSGSGAFEVRDGVVRGVDLLGTVLEQLKQPLKAAPADAVSRQTPFATLTAALSLRNGRASLSLLRMDSDDFTLKASGSAGLTGAIPLNLRAEMRLSEKASRQFPPTSAVGQLLNDQGRVAIPVVIRGTAADPLILPDAKLLAKRTGKRLSERVLNEVMGDEVEQLQETGKSLLKGLLGR